MLDRLDGGSRVGVDVGVTLPETTYDAVLRIEPHVRLMSRRGIGVHATIPVSRSFGGRGDTLAVGNPELGAHGFVRQAPWLAWVFRVGVVLPLAPDELDVITTNQLGVFPRFTDLALAARSSSFVRFSTSSLIVRGALFLRVDAGVDAGTDVGTNGTGGEIVRFNAAAGVDLGRVALGLELVNLWLPDEDVDGDHVLHVIGATARLRTGSLSPMISVGAPLDARLRDRATLFAAAGLELVLR